jgi:hypothetical protein
MYPPIARQWGVTPMIMEEARLRVMQPEEES